MRSDHTESALTRAANAGSIRAASQAKAAYRLAIEPARDTEGAAWWAEVIREVHEVIAAPSVAAAARMIEWWHHDWSMVGDTPRAAAARLRAAAKKVRQA